MIPLERFIEKPAFLKIRLKLDMVEELSAASSQIIID